MGCGQSILSHRELFVISLVNLIIDHCYGLFRTLFRYATISSSNTEYWLLILRRLLGISSSTYSGLDFRRKE